MSTRGAFGSGARKPAAGTPGEAAAAAGLLAWLLLLASCGSPIVGAECRKGFVSCDGRCVDTTADPANCGSCGHDCGDLECKAAECGPGPRTDGGSGQRDAGADDGGPREPDASKIGIGTPFQPDGGLTFPDPGVASGCGIGETACSGMCVDLQTDHDHCGACGYACAGDQYCVQGECKAICDPPLQLCRGHCVDLETSPNNCGVCGRVCASGICDAGVCADVVPGQLVVIGHDYHVPSQASTTMRRIAGNSLFLARGSPVRVLGYRGSATSESINGVHAAINTVVSLDGREWTEKVADPDRISEQLGQGVDAFIIYAQDGSTDAELTDFGQRWGLSISQFLLRGGVVVMFENASTHNAGTYQLLEPAGLFTASKRESIARQTLRVVSPGIGIAARTTNKYRSADTSVHFLGITSTGTVVVVDGDDDAVVVHRVVAMP